MGDIIEISTLTESDIGRWVIYKAGLEGEIGKIKSWNDIFIFVVYSCNDNWDKFQEYTAEATEPNDLIYKT